VEAIQNNGRALIKLHRIAGLALRYLVKSYWIHLTVKDEVLRRKLFSTRACRYTGYICKIIHLTVNVKNKPADNFVGLIVANHTGFIDIFSLCSMMPNLFITSQEMHETPVFGLLTEFGGCAYVDRRNRSNIMKELEDIVEFLRIGFRVVLYPEATSYNAEEILPFKRTLLTAAAFAGVPILPCVFNFKTINGEPFSIKYRDSVCYYGDIPAHVSIWRALKLKEITVEVEFLKEVRTTPEDDRAKMADSIRQMIVEKFRPVSSVSN
jgi:1-acyl-sn-glycerol-3-phosphate acyltransferase